MNRSTKRLVIFKELFISFLHTCIFSAFCFRQRTYMALSHMNGAQTYTSYFESHWVPYSYCLRSHMFSDESNKLETHTNVKTK